MTDYQEHQSEMYGAVCERCGISFLSWIWPKVAVCAKCTMDEFERKQK